MTAANDQQRKALRLRATLHDFEKAQYNYILSLLRLGGRIQHKGEEKATVIILSYKRMKNIPRILNSVLLCGFVDRIIVSNNNPSVDLSPYIKYQDPRIKLIQHKVRKGPSYRYDLAQEFDSKFYICIDDDVFPSPWQLLYMFKSLLRTLTSPQGCTGAIYHPNLRSFEQLYSRTLFPGNFSRPVDVILHIYYFTRKHLDRYFEILKAIAVRNEDIHSSEDVILSFTGAGRPLFVDVGYMPQCPTKSHPDVATWQKEGFKEYRNDLYMKLCALRDEGIETR